MDVKIDAEKLKSVVRAFCRNAGSEEVESGLVAEHLVMANLSGHDSHGVGMIPAYLKSMNEDGLKANQHVTVDAEAGAILRLDGHSGYGQVIGQEAMDLGIALAAKQGVAVVALRRSHHLGRIGTWGEQCAEAGMVSIHYVNAPGYRPIVAPYGGSDARYSTNPYCTAVPATDGNPAMIFDMATSNIAMGKVRVANNKGVEVPPGSLIDAHGNETNDPGVMYSDPKGALRSVGNHKGYGLALVCELLAGGLTNGGGHIPERFEGQNILNNMLSVILDPNAIGDAGFFLEEIDKITAHVKESPPAPGVDAVMVPGDPERKMRAERGATGVPVDDETWRQIVETAGEVGLGAGEIERLIQA
jgi:uncharacterized oxidoreductase